MLASMDEIHGIVESKLEKVTIKLGYMGKKCATLAQPLSCPLSYKEQKMPALGKEQAQKARYLMLWERSLHLVESRRMT